METICEVQDNLAQPALCSGLKPSGVAYEFYLNDPTETPPSQLQTKIVFPVS